MAERSHIQRAVGESSIREAKRVEEASKVQEEPPRLGSDMVILFDDGPGGEMGCVTLPKA